MKIIDQFFLKKQLRGRSERDSDIINKLRLTIPAQGADIAPPLGPALAQSGLNINIFCKKFNEKTQNFDKEVMLKVIIYLYRNKSLFKFDLFSPPVSFLLYECCIYFLNNLDKMEIKLNEEENNEEEKNIIFFFPRKVPLSVFYKIVLFKNRFDGNSLVNTMKIVLSTFKSMKVKISYDEKFYFYE